MPAQFPVPAYETAGDVPQQFPVEQTPEAPAAETPEAPAAEGE